MPIDQAFLRLSPPEEGFHAEALVFQFAFTATRDAVTSGLPYRLPYSDQLGLVQAYSDIHDQVAQLVSPLHAYQCRHRTAREVMVPFTQALAAYAALIFEIPEAGDTADDKSQEQDRRGIRKLPADALARVAALTPAPRVINLAGASRQLCRALSHPDVVRHCAASTTFVDF
jgi:hypothetical protein